MPHALIAACTATLAFAALYLLAAWINPHVTPHYYQVAQNPELASRPRAFASWLLKVAFLYGLLGWIAEIANIAHATVRTWPAPLAFLGHAMFLFAACAAIMAIVWQAYKLGVEFTAITPEFMIGVALCGYELFAILPRAHFPWNWLPGLH
jgi:hypothetical protein